MRKIIYIIFLTLVLAACANLGTPDGGAFDEDPPKILGTSPKYGAVNAKNKKIVLMFDENIKLDNAMEKVVISPPQINQPEIEAMGKRITITLNDSLKPNTTYTIDFSDAIQDNNEGNPMDDYAFTFSTGEMVDTFQISGYVLGAADLEPMKGLLVGLHRIEEGEEDLPDSIFRTREFERVSRTDASGHFVIKGLNPETRYRAFALKDQDQNFMFTQKSEMIGFNRQIITSSAKPDIKHDTIWHDSIHYDSIISIPYTHFYPDNIVLTAFEEEGQNRAFLKWERPQLERFTLFFTENGAQQTLFGRQLRLAFRGHFSHQDIAGTHFRAYPDDTPVVQVFQSLVADAWHVPCDLFRTQLCVAGFGFIFFNMYGCIDIIPDKALGQKNRVLIVITFPGHKADQRILAESEFASAG